MNEANNIDSSPTPKRPELSIGEMHALLKWYQAAGVTLGVAGAPIDQFALHASKKTLAKAPNKTPQSVADSVREISADPIKANLPNAKTKIAPTAQLPIDQEQGDPEIAKRNAAKANNLEALEAALEELPGCSLRVRATKMVFGNGNCEADIMFVGKAPSREDDLQGLAFCGKAGALLDHMLQAIGLARQEVYLTNIVPWRPPGNRGPAPHEIAMCLPFVKRQIELIAPSLLISFGELATKSLFGENTSVNQLQGQWHDLSIGSHKLRAMASLHPELLLKQPVQKRVSWAHLQKIRQAVADQCLT